MLFTLFTATNSIKIRLYSYFTDHPSSFHLPILSSYNHQIVEERPWHTILQWEVMNNLYKFLYKNMFFSLFPNYWRIYIIWWRSENRHLLFGITKFHNCLANMNTTRSVQIQWFVTINNLPTCFFSTALNYQWFSLTNLPIWDFSFSLPLIENVIEEQKQT